MKMSKAAAQARKKGFTLVELMVALLVLAIGLLGLAALQAKGLSNNHNAYLRTQATLLAQDMADRMRGNRAALASYTGTQTSDDCSTGSCTSAQMAGYDLAQWNIALTTRLPGATGAITSSGNIYTISVSWVEKKTWKENQSDPSSVTTTMSMSFQP
ncbi:MAG: type IV pilus modification protein PilV [Candidatus Methylumidiphilus sp.]